MNVSIDYPKTEYPYLAIFAPGGNEFPTKIPNSDEVFVLSKNNAGEVLVQPLMGGELSFVTKSEKDYQKLPVGAIVILKQS